MGERLVIEVKRSNKVIATAYYHWSAHSRPAINILHSMYTHVLSKADSMSDDELLLSLIRFAENSTALGYIDSEEAKQEIAREFEERFSETSETVQYMLQDLFLSNGGLTQKDVEFAKSKFPNESFKENVSRNEGLISITEKSISEALYWAEGTIAVDLDNNKVLNGVIYEYDIASYLAETEDWDDEEYISPDDLPQSPINFGEFLLNETVIVKDVIEISQSNWIRYENVIYQLKDE